MKLKSRMLSATLALSACTPTPAVISEIGDSSAGVESLSDNSTEDATYSFGSALPDDESPAEDVALSIRPAPADDHPMYESLRREATQKLDSVVVEYPDFTLVKYDDLTLYYFTKPNHPAHPGVIKRTITQADDGAWHANEQGWSFASDEAQPAFKAWLAQIVELDRQMKEAIDRAHGSTPSDDSN